MDELLAWKQEERKPCLLVRGARQVGKTFIIEQFARDNYENYIYINFELMPSMKSIFDGDLDFRTLRLGLEVNFPGVKIEKGKTILFLDEIGACPRARVALKTFAVDGTLDVIASGSLLGLYYREITSYPVGYERSLELRPLDFEEFLWATGVSDDVIDLAREHFTKSQPLPAGQLTRLADLFRIFLLVGGMPAVVNAYLATGSLTSAREVQAALLDNYRNDIVKYASVSDKPKILRTFDSIPMQLAKKNKKFTWADIDPSPEPASERKYGSAINWLKDAGLVNICHNLQEPAAPLMANARPDCFKIYLRDTGLLLAMLEPGVTKAIFDGDNLVNQGGIVENVVASELAAHGHPLMYFERKNTLEVDFLINPTGDVTAIEVKSGNNTQAKSLNIIIQKYPTVTRCIKLEKTNLTIDDKQIEHLPLFMAMFL